ncbi:hypothetical protein [Bacillus sp. 7894-2]|uniref:hypothetical protein n=1 Tax=Bacillus sp. 7894-2 TaxID=2021695 RepID=UPI000BA6CFA9|nr:hypothetical protein [Bacillus sp. 7894-2]PAE24709.1 hypothetical protein CHI10_11310 [Bacillus sp. 7894-2]
MEPRGVRIKRMRRKRRKQMAKTAATSFALSSSIVVGAHFISPTYAQFNSTDEANSTIEACFIFPRTIEKEYVTKSEDIFKKLDEEIQQALSIKSSITEIDADAKLKNVKPYSNGHTNPSEPAADSSASIKGLTATRSSLESHINSMQNNLSTAKQDLNAVNSLSSQLSASIQQLENYNTALEAAVTKSQTHTEELTTLLDTIKGFKDQAITECTYEETYFDEQISKMNSFSEKAETLLTQVKKEQTASLEKVISYKDKLNHLRNTERDIQNEISSLVSEIDNLNNSISSIDAQIQKLEKEQQEAEQKKKAEKEAAEKKKNESKPSEEKPAADPSKEKPSEEKTEPAEEPAAEQPQGEENSTSESASETTQQNESPSEDEEPTSEEAK